MMKVRLAMCPVFCSDDEKNRFQTFFCLMTGLCRSIGVSNFLIRHLEELKDDSGVIPHVNQVRIKAGLLN